MTGASPDRAAGPGGHRRQARLDGFWRSLPYQPDRFQREAGEALEDGATVVVTAPTGSGKTLVAEAAVHLALESGERAFYTTPIKALSNQKFGDFIVEYGHDLVGLLTGDNSINGGAPIVVMTTEVLRNMIYAGSEDLSRLGVVILDEVHYLQDRARGPVWEEIIIHAPRHIQLVGLVGNHRQRPRVRRLGGDETRADAAGRGDLATGAAGEPVHRQGPLVAAIGADVRDLSGE